jgi:hypothetical protein
LREKQNPKSVQLRIEEAIKNRIVRIEDFPSAKKVEVES